MKLEKTKKFITLLTLGTSIAFANVDSPNSSLGRGILDYDVEAGLKDRCVQVKPEEIVTEDVRKTTYYMKLVKSKEELYDKISMNQSADASYGLFSAGLRASFVKEVDWKQTSNYILVRAIRTTNRLTINSDITLLKPESRDLLLDGKFNFAEACGNSFAKTINFGGEIYGLIEIQSSDYNEKQKIKAKLEAEGQFDMGSASASSSYKRTIRKLNSDYQVKVSFRHLGGEQIQVPTSIDELLEVSERIEEITDAHPVPISMNVRDYTTLSNYEFDIHSDEVRIRENLLQKIDEKIKIARDLHAKVIYTIKHSYDFKRVNLNSLNQYADYLEDKILDLKEMKIKGRSFLFKINVDEIKLDTSFRLPEMKRRARRRQLRVTCEEMRSPICGVETYLTKVSAACGAKGVNTGTGPACGKVFVKKESASCGVLRWKKSSGPACGVHKYNKRRSSKCGRRPPPHNGRRKCRRKEFGVESYKTCRHPDFGVEKYISCRHSNHGIERYEECAHKDFGYKFNSCEHFSHGPSTYGICNVAQIGSQQTSCPSFK